MRDDEAADVRPPEDLPAPDRPLGPAGLGVLVGAPRVDADGVWFAVAPPLGLDGPPGVLQGGLTAGLTVELARLVDRHGAPLHALTARLAAPTVLGEPLAAHVVPGPAAGWYEVTTWQRGAPRVTATVELTGSDPLDALADLVALADGPPPDPTPDPLYPTCFVCGTASNHPLALRTPPAFMAPDRLSVPWVPDPGLVVPGTDGADGPGHVALPVVAAALDCPSAWAAVPAARDAGFRAVLLGSLRLQVAAPIEALDPVRVTARMDAQDGRKLRARSAVIDSDGRALAMLDALHIAVDALPDVGG